MLFALITENSRLNIPWKCVSEVGGYTHNTHFINTVYFKLINQYIENIYKLVSLYSYFYRVSRQLVNRSHTANQLVFAFIHSLQMQSDSERVLRDGHDTSGQVQVQCGCRCCCSSSRKRRWLEQLECSLAHGTGQKRVLPEFNKFILLLAKKTKGKL